MGFSIKKEKKLKKRLKRLRREQAENERLIGTEAALAENEKHIDEIGKEYSKLKKQRRFQRYQVTISAPSTSTNFSLFHRNYKKTKPSKAMMSNSVLTSNYLIWNKFVINMFLLFVVFI